MNDRIDAFIENLQDKIFDETREAYGTAGFQRWRNPRYNGRLAEFDAHASVTGTCGDTMEIYLKFRDDHVEDASYVTNGCGSSAICGSFAAEMAIGKNPDQLADITGEDVLKKIGKFPEDEKHCAFLAAGTLQEALREYMTQNTRRSHDKGGNDSV